MKVLIAVATFLLLSVSAQEESDDMYDDIAIPSTFCVDAAYFHDNINWGCEDYEANSFECSQADVHANDDGISAAEACCVCGGGTDVAAELTAELTYVYDSIMTLGTVLTLFGENVAADLLNLNETIHSLKVELEDALSQEKLDIVGYLDDMRTDLNILAVSLLQGQSDIQTLINSKEESRIQDLEAQNLAIADILTAVQSLGVSITTLLDGQTASIDQLRLDVSAVGDSVTALSDELKEKFDAGTEILIDKMDQDLAFGDSITEMVRGLTDKVVELSNDNGNNHDTILEGITSIESGVGSQLDTITSEIADIKLAGETDITGLRNDLTSVNQTIHEELEEITVNAIERNGDLINTFNFGVLAIGDQLTDIDTHLTGIQAHVGDMFDDTQQDVDLKFSAVEDHLDLLDTAVADVRSDVEQIEQALIEHHDAVMIQFQEIIDLLTAQAAATLALQDSCANTELPEEILTVAIKTYGIAETLTDVEACKPFGGISDSGGSLACCMEDCGRCDTSESCAGRPSGDSCCANLVLDNSDICDGPEDAPCVRQE